MIKEIHQRLKDNDNKRKLDFRECRKSNRSGKYLGKYKRLLQKVFKKCLWPLEAKFITLAGGVFNVRRSSQMTIITYRSFEGNIKGPLCGCKASIFYLNVKIYIYLSVYIQ